MRTETDPLYYGLSQEDMQEILEHTRNELFVVDANLHVIFINKSLCQELGCQPEDMLGRPIGELENPIFSEKALTHCKNQHRRLIWRIQIPGVGDVISTSVPYYDKTGDLIFISTLRHCQFADMDITVKPIAADETDHYLLDRNLPRGTTGFITHAPAMQAVIKLAERVADSDIALMITGKTGTGKTMMARYIHERSKRAKGPLVYVNCATIPPNLIEAELFGYTPHAFTGASPQGKIGLLEQANGGTLFLDEIAEVPINLQAKLLTVIETCKFLPVGGSQYRQTDTRVISATNQDLLGLIAEKKFREDLYWRLSAIPLYIPSLEERPEDVPLLIYYYLNRCNQKFNTSKTISHSLFLSLTRYTWPGNIRQLKNAVERFFIISSGMELTLQDLPVEILDAIGLPEEELREGQEETGEMLSLALQMDRREGEAIRIAVEKYGSSRKVAQALGISQSKANRLIQKYLPERSTEG